MAVVTAKDKLRALRGQGLLLGSGSAVSFSAENADQAGPQTHGIGEVLVLVAMSVPAVYSAELSEFVLSAAVRPLESSHWDIKYAPTTDYIPTPMWSATGPWAALPWSL